MSRVLLFGGFAPSLILFRAPLLRALVEAGHEVIAAAPDEDPRVPEAMESMGVRWYPINFERNRVQPARDLLFVRRIRRMLRELKPDRLLCYTIKPNIYGGWAAQAEGVPSAAMVTGLGTVFMNHGWRRTVAIRMFRRACRHHDHVFFQNTDDRDDMINAGVVEDSSRIVMTAGSGVDLDLFPMRPLPDKPSFLMLARLLQAKGVREFLEAAAMVKAECPDAEIRLGGMEDPGSGGVPMTEITAAERAGAIEYIGHLDDVHQALDACSVYVLPSWHEGTPRSVLEAMATGRAIITTDARGCRETVEDGVNGLLVPLRSPADLGQAMISLAADSNRRAAMAQASRRRAEEVFDAREVARVMMKALSL
ncbi:MAG: glycosyltransferase family 4 protein [Phycisphaerales bacterium]|nr:glycosyltransferase family 4 protein [Phycisphaerales bacterium]